ncbi:MAG: hypothetical protein V9E94_19510 [Microthrixaceae bacterium]
MKSVDTFSVMKSRKYSPLSMRSKQFNKDLQQNLPIGVAGVGDGGLLAMHASALDQRIDATWVAGYFQPRESVWEEPIDRNVWRLLGEFGDAEVAAMIAPRPLVIEAAQVPEVITPLPVKPNRRGGAAPGKIQTAAVEAVRNEFARLSPVYRDLKAAEKVTPGRRYADWPRGVGTGPRRVP